MKATGIVRRIDDLGRVVIPKEIRRTMRIQEGDPMEIFTTNDGEVIYKRYEAEVDASRVHAELCDIFEDMPDAVNTEVKAALHTLYTAIQEERKRRNTDV